MKSLFLLGLNTNLEYRREKFFISVLLLALGLIAVSSFLGSFSLSEKTRIVIHLGLSSTQLCLWFISAFLAGGVLHRELERQTCLMVLSRPISRQQFLLGKYFGLVLVLLQAFLLLLFAVIILLFFQISLAGLLQAGFSLFFESLVIAALALFFSVFLRPVLASSVALGITLMSYWWPDFSFFAEKSSDSFLIFIKDVLAWAIPQFHRFNFKSVYWIEQGGDLKIFLISIVHAAFWISISIYLANILFKKKDLN